MKKVAGLLVFALMFTLTATHGHASENGPVQLTPGTSVTLKKVPVVDSRAVRGFLGTPVDGSITSWGYRGVVVEYPDTGKVWPDIGDAVVSIAFDARLLKRLCDAAISQERLAPSVTLHVSQPDGAAIFELNEMLNHDAYIDGVIMPLRR